jgi:hypothetical protein
MYASNPTSVFTNRKRFKANTSYTILIDHPTLGTVKATTFIPPLPTLKTVDTASDQFNGNNVMTATITWRDSVNKDEYYIIEVLKELLRIDHYFIYQGKRYNYDTPQGKEMYDKVKNTPGVRIQRDTVGLNKFTRINLYTQDNNSDNSHIDNLSNPFRRIFFTDDNFNGQLYTTKVYIDRQFFTDPNNKGRIRLQLKSASKELFTYLEQYEKYKTDFGSVPTNQLVSPTGNIKNGLGIFGGSAKREKIYYFDTLF